MDGTSRRQAANAIAERQHGVVSLEQLRELGFNEPTVRHQLGTGVWDKACTGVVAIAGSPPTPRRELMAAVLSRPRAFASGRSAAWLHNFGRSTPPGRHEITVPFSASARSGIATVHRSQFFSTVSTSRVTNITSASPAETAFRMAEVLSATALERLIDDLMIVTPAAIEELGDIYVRYQGHRMRGMAKIRPILLDRLESQQPAAESALEQLADSVLGSLAIPEIVKQAPLPWALGSGGRVDRLIPDWKLIIELDGRRWHTRTEAFETDRLRDNAATAHGYATLRLTWNMLTTDPDRCRRLVQAAGARR